MSIRTIEQPSFAPELRTDEVGLDRVARGLAVWRKYRGWQRRLTGSERRLVTALVIVSVSLTALMLIGLQLSARDLLFR